MVKLLEHTSAAASEKKNPKVLFFLQKLKAKGWMISPPSPEGRCRKNFLGTAHPSFLLGVQISRNAAKIGPQTAFAEHAAAFFGPREPVSMMKVAQKERPS